MEGKGRESKKHDAPQHIEHSSQGTRFSLAWLLMFLLLSNFLEKKKKNNNQDNSQDNL